MLIFINAYKRRTKGYITTRANANCLITNLKKNILILSDNMELIKNKIGERHRNLSFILFVMFV